MTYDSLGTFPEATSESYNTTDSNGNGYEKFEDNDEIDRTRITEVFIIIIGKTSWTSMFTLIAVNFIWIKHKKEKCNYL